MTYTSQKPSTGWDKGLLQKGKEMASEIICTIYLIQYVAINGCKSDVTGVPQDSVLGALLFLIYIYDISTNLSTVPYLYADEPSLF